MKIVYNSCYGGFALSREAILLARKISGNPKWGGVALRGDVYEKDGRVLDKDYGFLNDGIKRHDPVLVRVVEELGTKASGSCSSLKVAEVATGSRYRIDEYDGNESVMTQDSYDWEIAD